MAFKEGVEDTHVHAFRSVRAKATELDEAVDLGRLTPHEAIAELTKFIGAVDIPAPKKETHHASEVEKHG